MGVNRVVPSCCSSAAPLQPYEEALLPCTGQQRSEYTAGALGRAAAEAGRQRTEHTAGALERAAADGAAQAESSGRGGAAGTAAELEAAGLRQQLREQAAQQLQRELQAAHEANRRAADHLLRLEARSRRKVRSGGAHCLRLDRRCACLSS